MRKTALALSLVAGLAAQAAPASAAASSTLSFSGRYTVASTQWSPTNNAVATTHSEAASKAGAVRAQAWAGGGRTGGWSAISAGVISQTATVEPSETGYRVAVTFTGVKGTSTGLQDGPMGTAISDTAAALAVGVRLSGECTSAVPCNEMRHAVSRQHDSVTVTFDYAKAVGARSTMIVRASAQAWIKTPQADGSADSANVTATVASITISPLQVVSTVAG